MIASYADLMQAVQEQPEPQRLLFVFCRAELPDDASAAATRTTERRRKTMAQHALTSNKGREVRASPLRDHDSRRGGAHKKSGLAAA